VVHDNFDSSEALNLWSDTQFPLNWIRAASKVLFTTLISQEVNAQNEFMYCFGDNGKHELLITSNIKAYLGFPQ